MNQHLEHPIHQASLTHIIPVILCGGSGSRLWPLSCTQRPKQFLRLLSEYTLFQDTLARLKHIPNMTSPIIISNVQHEKLVEEQMRQVGASALQIILEPSGRNTAPAIAVAALQALKLYPNQDPLLLVLPADHAILDKAAFEAAVLAAQECVKQGKLGCFGVVPTRPETGYGYIKRGDQLSCGSCKIEAFVEKPSLELAEKYLATGEYYWNSGMFMFGARSYLQELKRYAPDILLACEATIANSEVDEGARTLKLNGEKFAACREQSIDYAVMELTNDAAVVPLNASWSDIGSWQAIWECSAKDQQNNVELGDVTLRESKNCYVRATSRKVVAIGLENCIIVETEEGVLVMDKDKCQKLKEAIDSNN